MVAEMTSVKLGERKADLQYLADVCNRSMDSLVIEAIDEYIENRQEQLAYERRAIRAYEHFQATGLHVTLEEINDWADSLLTETPKRFPACHK